MLAHTLEEILTEWEDSPPYHSFYLKLKCSVCGETEYLDLCTQSPTREDIERARRRLLPKLQERGCTVTS